MDLLIYSYRDSSRLRYILGVLFREILGVSYDLTHSTQIFKDFNGPKVNYSDKPLDSKSVWIIPHNILFENKLVRQNITVSEWDNIKIFFKTSSESEWPFDIFAASFYLASRYEEYLSFKADRYGRFEASESLAFKHGFLEEPVVNLWAAKLRKALHGAFPGFNFPLKKFEYISTIDVDNAWAYLHKGLPRTAGAFVKSLLRLDFSDFKRRMRVLTGYDADPYYVFDYLEEQERKYGFISIYFFLTGRYGRYDTNISMKRDVFKNLILDKVKNSEAGIHPSYKSNRRPVILKQEVKQFFSLINRPVKKSRQHFLILEFPQTYKRLIEAGITEDYSLGYSSAPGFRAGICTPFRFYDLSQEKETGLILVPFHIMDVTLREYMRLTPDEAINKIQEIVSKIKNVNGTFVSLWHNESLSETAQWKGWRRVYEEMIKELKEGQHPEEGATPGRGARVFLGRSPQGSVPFTIRYLRHNEIDKVKWDKRISGAVNEHIYARSWYLDIVSPGWDALITGDYEAVMPLAWKKKLGIYYLHQPYFTQQLGVFSSDRSLLNDISVFIENIPERISYAGFNLNTENNIKKNILKSERITYELDLSKSYEELKADYSKSNSKNIKKARSRNIKIVPDTNLNDIVNFYRKAYHDLGFKFLKKHHYKNFEYILDYALKNNLLKSYVAVTQENIVCAMCIFLMGESRSLIFSASNKLGKKYSAVFLLIDTFIEEHAERNLILDFAGSNISGIAYRNKGFGAKEKNYFTIYINKLPWFYNFILKLINKFK